MAEANLKDIIKFEYGKCYADPVYFIKKYCWISHPTRGKIKFELYPFQEKVIQNFQNHRYNIILKSRQLGISTVSAAYSLWLGMFHDDKNILVVATKQKVASNLIAKIRTMHKELPVWLKKQHETEENNKLSIRFSNGSVISAIASTGDVGRSEALSLVIIDEAAFIRDFDTKWASLQQTLATGGNAIVLSTPNGMGNWYHKTWIKAMSDENGFFPITLHWTVHPDRDQTWRDAQDAELGPRLAGQECLDGKTLVTVKDKETGRVFDITIEELYNSL